MILTAGYYYFPTPSSLPPGTCPLQTDEGPTTLNEGNQSARLNTGSLFRLSLENCDNL